MRGPTIVGLFCLAKALLLVRAEGHDKLDVDLRDPHYYADAANARAEEVSVSPASPHREDSASAQADCFPSLTFTPPTLANNTAPSTPRAQWWCSPLNENGFLGFSYYVEVCQNSATLLSNFRRMRSEFGARYVRLYSWCDWDAKFYDKVINAAYQTGLGVYATIWFGFDGTDDWIWRRDSLLNAIRSLKLAPYVIRSIDVGSEPLYDWVLTPRQLADQVIYVKNQVRSYGINVSISEMQYGYTVQGDAQVVLNAVDVVHAHQLPFFAQDATIPQNSWPTIQKDTDWFRNRTNGAKKIVLTQTGWPSNADVWQPNSPDAVASLAAQKAYADLLDSSCEVFKSRYGHGGIGWFWQIWNDNSLPGWGIVSGTDGPAKIQFKPRTAC